MKKNGKEREEHEGDKNEIIKMIRMNMTSGIDKPYYIGYPPNEIQSDTRRSLLIRFPLGTFASGLYSNKNSDTYIMLTFQREGSYWKIINYVGKEAPDAAGEIDWIEVKPTDYLG